MCQVCPRRLGGPPDQPCPLALERILAIQADPRSDHDGVGCPWYVISQEHNYCFWSYAETLQDSPHTDREIAELLGIPAKEVERIADEAIEKYVAAKDSPEIRGFREAVQEHAAAQQPDNTIYMPGQFREQVAEAGKAADEKVVPNLQDRPKRRGRSQPIHRSGLRRDIYFSKRKTDDSR